MTLSAGMGSLNSTCNEESPHIYFVLDFPRSRGSIFTLQVTPPQPPDFMLRIRLFTWEDVKTIRLGHPNWSHRPGILSWCPGYSYSLLLFITVDIFNIYNAKQDPKWVIWVIWYGTLFCYNSFKNEPIELIF